MALFAQIIYNLPEYLDTASLTDLKSASRINPKFINKWLDEYFSVSGNRVPPRAFIEWIKLASTHNCSIRPSDYKHIFEDLQPFKMPGMSNEYIKVASNIIEAYEREVLFVPKQKLPEILEKLPLLVGNSLELVEDVLNPDIEFSVILNYSDESMVLPSDDQSFTPYNSIDDVFERSDGFYDLHEDYQLNNSLLSVPAAFSAIPMKFPVFSINRIDGFYDIILPTRRTGLSVLSKEQREAAAKNSNWNDKFTKAIFRGTTLGIDFKEAKRKGLDVTINPRFKLHDLALDQQGGRLNCSVPLDFSITKYLQYNGELSDLKKLKERFPELSNTSGLMELFQHKYVVLTDGNGWPDKVAAVMLSGSLVFLATIHEDWVIRQLIDGVHYIKIKPDMSDLLDKLEWAHENDGKAKEIAENGRNLAIRKFDTNHMQVYNAFLMMEYQNLFSLKKQHFE